MLDNFIAYTNYCEAKGYDFKFNYTKKGITADLYYNNTLKKKGSKYYESCLDAQKKCYTLLFNSIK